MSIKIEQKNDEDTNNTFCLIKYIIKENILNIFYFSDKMLIIKKKAIHFLFHLIELKKKRRKIIVKIFPLYLMFQFITKMKLKINLK